MNGIAGVVGASSVIDAAGLTMSAAEAATSLITKAVIPPSSDPSSATATVNQTVASLDMTTKSQVAFASVQALSAILKSQALTHAGADMAGAASLLARSV
jgi:hypothetical protein